MAIRLRKETEDRIREAIESGAYPSAEDLVEAAVWRQLELDRDTDELPAAIPDLRPNLREQIAKGRASPLVPAGEVFARLYERQSESEKTIEDRCGRWPSRGSRKRTRRKSGNSSPATTR